MLKMRTNIEIDDNLMREAMKAAGSASKRETVEQGLRLLVQMHRQRDIKKLRAALGWKGDIDSMRCDK
jgi:Arc/MetJ family transcription regulator